MFNNFNFACLPVPVLPTSPCAAASEASMECMNRNSYDRDACLDYFQAYRDCKKAWVSFLSHVPRMSVHNFCVQIQQRKEDRRAGRA